MSDYEEIRRKYFEPAPVAGGAGFGRFDEPPFSAAERHRRARMTREGAKLNPLLESLAASEVDPATDPGEPIMEDTYGHPAGRAEKGVFAGLRRFLFGRDSRGRDHRPEPYRQDNDGQYASAVASAVRMASGERDPVPAETGFPNMPEPADQESAMYPYPPHHPDAYAQPQAPEPARQVAPQQAPWPPAPMMPPAAFWPVHPAYGWPMPPQAYGAHPFDQGMAWPPHPAHFAQYAAQYAAPYAPPPQAWQQQAIAHQPAPAALPERVVDLHPVMPAGEDAEMEDLRESVRALRDMVELLMQRRSERNRWAA